MSAGPSPRRTTYVALALTTIAVGLVVHRINLGLPAVARDMLGDALWAMMVSWWMGVLSPTRARLLRSAISLAVCFAVETSQLVHTPLLDDLRATPAGHLILGQGFDPRDFLSYALGVTLAFLIEPMTTRRRPDEGRSK